MLIRNLSPRIKMNIANIPSQIKLKLNTIATLVIGLAFTVLTFRYQLKLLHFYQWEDESETIVSAKMMAAGHQLYLEIFNPHGPLVFLPGYLLEKFGSFDIAGHRVCIALLQLLMLVSIYKSPLLAQTNPFAKITYTAVAATILVVFFPFHFFSHMYTYQVMAGLLAAIILAQFLIPNITLPASANSQCKIIFYNLLIVCLPFFSIAYIPAAILLFLAGLKKNHLKLAVAGCLIGLGINLLYLATIGSIEGFYALHYYVPTKLMANMGGSANSSINIYNFLFEIYKGIAAELFAFFLLIVFILAAGRISQSEKGFPTRTLLMSMACISFLIRGGGFQGVGFYFSCLVVPIIFLKEIKSINYKTVIFLIPLLIICAIKLSAHNWYDKNKLNAHLISGRSDFSDLVQKITNKDDRILAFTYKNAEYIYSDRLPASGNHNFFPWQAKYSENPLIGKPIDTCSDIRNNKPKIILIDGWTPIDSYPFAEYAKCIMSELNAGYSQVKGTPYWIRNDVFPSNLDKHPK